MTTNDDRRGDVTTEADEQAAHREVVAARKQRREATKRPPVITVDAYNALWAAYREDPHVGRAAKAAGVKTSVARWYCEGPADKGLGFVQLAARLKQLQIDVHTLEDHGTKKWRAKQLQVVDDGLRTLEGLQAVYQRAALKLAEAVRDEKIDPVGLLLDSKKELALKDVLSGRDKLVRLGLLLRGEADSAPATNVPAAPNFAEWTAEETAAYCERGVLPERERNQ